MEETQTTEKSQKNFYKKWWFWTIIALVVVIAVGAIFGLGSDYPKDLIDLPEAEYKAQCQVYTYDEVARNPNDYNKKLAKFTGEVVQIIKDDDKLQMRVNVTLNGDIITYYSDTMYVYYTINNNVNVLEHDIITMYGELRGTQEYKSTLGVQVSIPKIYVKFIEINN